MSDIQVLIKMLQSNNANERYDACEELRVSSSIRPEALEALRAVTTDENKDVADAAKRAINLHAPTLNLDEALQVHQQSSTLNSVASTHSIENDHAQNKPQSNTGGLIVYYVVLLLISIFSCPTIIFGAAVTGNNMLYGAVFIFMLLLIIPYFFMGKNK